MKILFLSKYKTRFIVYLRIRKKQRLSDMYILQKHCTGVNVLIPPEVFGK
jgi:hypothetical protein